MQGFVCKFGFRLHERKKYRGKIVESTIVGEANYQLRIFFLFFVGIASYKSLFMVLKNIFYYKYIQIKPFGTHLNVPSKKN